MTQVRLILTMALIATMAAGCQTPVERRIAAEREQRLNERLDDIQSQLLSIQERQRHAEIAGPARPAPTLQPGPVVPVRSSGVSVAPPTAKQRISRLAARHNLKPVERRSTHRTRARSRGKASASMTLRKKHIRVGVPVRVIQQALANAGCSPGVIDGRVGPKTVEAIKAFQRKEGLKEDGVVGPVTWARLRSAGG